MKGEKACVCGWEEASSMCETCVYSVNRIIEKEERMVCLY